MSLEITGVRVKLGGMTILDDFHLTVPAGDSVALLGASGSGKTTALRAVAGFVRADAGSIRLADRDITGEPPERRQLALIHQQFLLFPHLTVGDNIAFSMRYHDVPASERRGRVVELLSLIGLEGLEHRYPHQLSGGQQQRVAIARALAVNPRLLLLDEPLSSLDRTLRERLIDELRALQQAHSMTMLYVTHDWNEAARIASRVALVDRGRIQQIGRLEDLLHRPRSTGVARFFGRRNLFPATVNGGGLTIDDLGLRLPWAPAEPAKVIAYIPGELIQLAPGQPGRVEILGTVVEVTPELLTTQFQVRCNAALLHVVVARAALHGEYIDAGMAVRLAVDPGSIHLLPVNDDGLAG